MGARTLPKTLPTTYLPGPTDKIGISQAESRFHLGTAQNVTRGYKKRSGGRFYGPPRSLCITTAAASVNETTKAVSKTEFKVSLMA